MGWETRILTGWENSYDGPCGILLYIATAFLSAVVVRVILTILWTFEKQRSQQVLLPEYYANRSAMGIFCRRFWVQQPQFGEESDFGIPFVLGFLELLVAPVLISTGGWVPIGGWLTLKTVAQWEVWKSNRHTFNRFLIGNLLLLIVAYFTARCFIRTTLT